MEVGPLISVAGAVGKGREGVGEHERGTHFPQESESRKGKGYLEKLYAFGGGFGIFRPPAFCWFRWFLLVEEE